MSNSTQRWADRNLFRMGRRWFLSAAGISVALPYLESLDPKKAYAAGAGTTRLFLFHMPAGVNVTSWAPSGTGTGFTLGTTHQPVVAAGLQSKVMVVTGLNGIGGPRGHTCGISGVLTGVGCQTNSTTNAESFDQVAASAMGAQSPFPSIQLGTTHNTENPNAESGYSTVLKDNLNWQNATTPLSRQIIPLTAFNQFFATVPSTPAPAAGGGAAAPPAPALVAKDAMRKSILDYSLAEGTALDARLGTSDRVKLDQYLSGLRALEKQIQTTPTVGQTGVCTPGTAPAAGKPSDIQAHVKLMLDMIVMAFQCGLTRVATFAYEHTTTEIQHTFLGVTAGYHSGVTHHNNQPAALANYTTVNTWFVKQYVYVLNALAAISDGTGTMLDNSVCMLFSELSDGNSHSNASLPMLISGTAGGKLQTGRAVSGSGANDQALLAILQALGTGATSFSRAKAPLASMLV